MEESAPGGAVCGTGCGILVDRYIVRDPPVTYSFRDDKLVVNGQRLRLRCVEEVKGVNEE